MKIHVEGIGEADYSPYELRELDRWKRELPREELLAVLEATHALKVYGDAVLVPPSAEELAAQQEAVSRANAERQEALPLQ